MTRLSRPRRTASNLSDSIHQQLNMYAVMASAAGVGMLALSQPAAAKIVYSSAHKLIESGQTVSLDLNHGGKADFSFGTQGAIRFWKVYLRARSKCDHGMPRFLERREESVSRAQV